MTIGTLGLGILLSVVLLALLACGADSNSVPPTTPTFQEVNSNSSGTASVPSSEAELGRLLFFDPRLSGDALVSCASCHDPEHAWADGLALPEGTRNVKFFRNTPTLLNASQKALLYWDGRFPKSEMATVIRDHLAEAHFMSIDGRLLVERLRQVPQYEQSFQNSLGQRVSYGGVLNALSAFIETLNSGDDAYSRHLAGNDTALSPSAQQGLELFQGKANCAKCHSGPLLSDGERHAIGVPENPRVYDDPLRYLAYRRFFRSLGVSTYATMQHDPGFYAITLDETDAGKFRTPALLEVGRTGPYMHNGVFESLVEVVEFYNLGGGVDPNGQRLLRTLSLTEDEFNSLVSFLQELQSDSGLFEAPSPPPYQPRRLGEN